MWLIHGSEWALPFRATEFPRIKGGKNFDVKQKWFGQMLKEIGQPMGKVQVAGH